jgi:hypothetical protein
MTRRSQRSRSSRRRPFYISKLLPWWLWALLSPISYFAFRFLAQATAGASPAADAVELDVLQHILPVSLQYAMPVVFAALSAFAVIHALPDQVDTRFTPSRPKTSQSRTSDQRTLAPTCPSCSALMSKRFAHHNGEESSFWGCTRYPSCRGTRPI